MAIDRNARVRLANSLSADRSLTHAQRGIIRALLMKFLDCRTGRARVDYDRIAEAAGCDRSTVRRAQAAIARFFEIFKAWKDRPGRNGGIVRGRDVNTYIVRALPAAQVSLQGQEEPGTTLRNINQAQTRVIHMPVDILTGLNTDNLTLTERLHLRALLRKGTATA